MVRTFVSSLFHPASFFFSRRGGEETQDQNIQNNYLISILPSFFLTQSHPHTQTMCLSLFHPATSSQPLPPSSSTHPSHHPTPTKHLKTPHLDAKSFRKVIDTLYQTISNHRSSSVFQQPIRDIEAPDYSSTVFRPMDLRSIRVRIKDGGIREIDEFERDMVLMFANAMLYNEKGSDVHRMAEEVSFYPSLSLSLFFVLLLSLSFLSSVLYQEFPSILLPSPPPPPLSSACCSFPSCPFQNS